MTVNTLKILNYPINRINTELKGISKFIFLLDKNNKLIENDKINIILKISKLCLIEFNDIFEFYGPEIYYEMDNIDESKLLRIKIRWKNLFNLKSLHFNKEIIYDTISINKINLLFLQSLRYGININKKNKLFEDLNNYLIIYNDIKYNKKIFGGYIDKKSDIKLEKINHIIELKYIKGKIRFHTIYPYYLYYPFYPPSAFDIRLLFKNSINDNYCYINLLISWEGIWLYFINPNLLKLINSKNNYDILDEVENIINDLKLLLGKCEDLDINRQKILDIKNINNEKIRFENFLKYKEKLRQLGGNIQNLKIEKRQINLQYIINTYNEIGIFLKLIPYKIKNIEVPILIKNI